MCLNKSASGCMYQECNLSRHSLILNGLKAIDGVFRCVVVCAGKKQSTILLYPNQQQDAQPPKTCKCTVRSEHFWCCAVCCHQRAFPLAICSLDSAHDSSLPIDTKRQHNIFGVPQFVSHGLGKLCEREFNMHNACRSLKPMQLNRVQPLRI